MTTPHPRWPTTSARSGGDAAPAALAVRAAAGDTAAFTALHARYARVVHAVLLARLPPQEADELVQEVFLRGWQRLAELRDPGAVGGWLMRIARNLAADRLRGRRTEVELPADLASPYVPHREAREVLDAVRALPEAYRETLLMRLVEGMTGPEIAERTGLTPGSVRVNLHRGMALLRERLGASEVGDGRG